MSQEAAPERAVPEQQGAGAPKGLLQQMEELMAALSADLSQLDADLQSTSDRLAPEPGSQQEPEPEPQRSDAHHRDPGQH
ncbi:hypothetical protein [Streptomyces sp. NPDC002825]|uniref:hypothetical protein n=1 Tax=Streptomyces sp. NPDC002825 TaxID=3154666 RepID=UPI003328B0B2